MSPKVLVFSYSYHGTVDESLVVSTQKRLRALVRATWGRRLIPPRRLGWSSSTTFPALERELSYGDVAAVLCEPAMTNIGIVLPLDGFFDGVRQLCDDAGTLLILDETHTISGRAGEGPPSDGAFDPTLSPIGKSLGGGVPCGAFGLSDELADRVLLAARSVDLDDVGGIGGTLAGNALSLAAMRAVLGEVLTEEAFLSMESVASAFVEGVRHSIDVHQLGWSITQLGARCEYRFAWPAPISGGLSAKSADPLLEEYLHLYEVNRGVLLTPFHNMALMCPATTLAHVSAHQLNFDAALAELLR